MHVTTGQSADRKSGIYAGAGSERCLQRAEATECRVLNLAGDVSKQHGQRRIRGTLV